jgi:hypothetical protein
MCQNRAVRVRLRLLCVLVALLTSACAGRGPDVEAEGGACFGASALGAHRNVCPASTRSGPLTPSPTAATLDRSSAYDAPSGTSCFAVLPDFQLRTCEFGDHEADTKVALIGNSHAAQWLPAIELIAAQEDWHVTSYLASQCALADVRQGFKPAASSKACVHWGRDVVEQVAEGGFDLVIMSNKISRGVPGLDAAATALRFQDGYADVLRPLQQAGLPVIGIRDTPSPAFDVPACLAANADDYTVCDGTRAGWLPAEPLVEAVAALQPSQLTVVDLTDYICHGETCSAAVGGVPVYFDVSHLTATYAKTLAPYLRAEIKQALAG